MLIHLWNSGLKSGGFQNSHLEPMVDPIEGLELIQMDQRGFGAVFELL